MKKKKSFRCLTKLSKIESITNQKNYSDAINKAVELYLQLKLND